MWISEISRYFKWIEIFSEGIFNFDFMYLNVQNVFN